jgi:hypothetical protein
MANRSPTLQPDSGRRQPGNSVPEDHELLTNQAQKVICHPRLVKDKNRKEEGGIYLGFLFGNSPPTPAWPPVFPETAPVIAPFAALPAKLPTSGTKLGFDVVP